MIYIFNDGIFAGLRDGSQRLFPSHVYFVMYETVVVTNDVK